jgi:arylsulfatase A-like enzyme
MISKSNPYEESMHIPFIIRWTGHIKPGMDNLLFSSPDIYPTLMGLMGFEPDIPATVEGKNFAGLFTGKEKMERPTSQLYFMTDAQLFGQPEGRSGLNLKTGERGIRTERYTLSILRGPKNKTTTFLWDRQADPFELHNIAAGKPGLVKELVENELIPWLTLTKDPWLE